VGELIAAYRFDAAANTIYHFVWGTFCDWYLELAKPMLQGADGPHKTETRAVAAWVLQNILRVLHPFAPFVTEELWEDFGDHSSKVLMLSAWPTQTGIEDDGAAAEIDWLVRVISAIRALRSEMNVPPSAPVSMLVHGLANAKHGWVDAHADVLARIGKVEKISLLKIDDSLEIFAKGAAQLVVDEATILIPLEGLIDIDKEKARLIKEITRLDIDIAKVQKKLGNEEFVAKARPEVVEENQERLAEWQESIERLGAALTRLGGTP
jgi:valyl-tRNA synthetase